MFCTVAPILCAINSKKYLRPIQISHLYGPIWFCMSLYDFVWLFMAPFGLYIPVWSCMIPYGPIWSHMVPNGPVWSRMVLYDLVWSCMVPHCPIWFCWVLFGPLWSFMVLQCFLRTGCPDWTKSFCIVSGFSRHKFRVPTWGSLQHLENVHQQI